MVDLIPGNTRNNNTRKNRRKMFMSTFHLNESSIDSSLGGTPPLARRHSHGLRGSKLSSFCLDDIDKDEDNEENKSRCPKKNSMLNASNTIGACNYLTKTREKKVSTTINNPSNISKPRKIKSFVRKNNFQHESQAPVIIVSNNHTDESTEKLSANAMKENVIKALTAEKSRPGRRERKRRRSCGDMDHIRAKWLLGFNLTMKCRSMSQEMISRHVTTQHRIKSTGRNKREANPEFSDKKAKEIEAAAQYFKRRLRILEITSDNSWGMARSTSK